MAVVERKMYGIHGMGWDGIGKTGQRHPVNDL